MQGVVIDKKLFSRSIKDKRKRSEDKEAITRLEMDYEVKFQQLKDILIEKLFGLINGKTSQGVINDLGEEVLPKGKKYTIKMLNAVDDFAHLVGGSWTTDEDTNELVADLLHNYKIKLNDIQGNLRRDKFTISVGDELPAGIMKLAKELKIEFAFPTQTIHMFNEEGTPNDLEMIDEPGDFGKDAAKKIAQ